MTIEEVKHADLQKAVQDINAVLDIKQNHVAGRQVLIDFIVNTIGGCIGPNPENPEEEIWADERAGNLSPETLNTYEALTAAADAGTDIGKETGPAPKVDINENGDDVIVQDGAEAGPAEKAETEVAGEETAAQPKECPEFGKGYDATDPACAKTCKRAEECQSVMAEAPKTAKPKREKAVKEPKAPAAERYGYVHAAHDAIMSGDMSRDDLAKRMVELYASRGKAGDLKQARRNLDSDLRSLLVFGVVSEVSGKIILANRG